MSIPLFQQHVRRGKGRGEEGSEVVPGRAEAQTAAQTQHQRVQQDRQGLREGGVRIPGLDQHADGDDEDEGRVAGVSSSLVSHRSKVG